ncbi:MAG: Ig-like domain-containing protein [Gammaproteobacteria bacterium]|nr:Ig-like domain-containing protein [Gammaproteobacteria bacterium]
MSLPTLRLFSLILVLVMVSACGGSSDSDDDDADDTDDTTSIQLPPTGIIAQMGVDSISLAWTNPDNTDFAGVSIRRGSGSFVADHNSGDDVYQGAGNSFTDSTLEPDTYYYSLYAFNTAGDYSSPTQVALTLADLTPPGVVTNLGASSSTENEITLSWQNPSDPDLAGIMIRRSDSAYALAHDEGEEVFSGLAETFTDNVPWGATYYYSAFAHDDETPANFSGPAIVSGVGIDTTPPQLISMDPGSGAADVLIDSGITLGFSEPLDPASITSSNIQLGIYYDDPFFGPYFSPVSASLGYDPVNFVVTLTPEFPLNFLQEYTVIVNPGVTDNSPAKNPLVAAEEWSFTTEADSYGPTITQVTPADGSQDVAVQTTIYINFSETIDSTSVDASTVLVSGMTAYIYGGHNYISITTDTGWLPFDQTISVTLTQGITDDDGNPMASDYSFSFTTEADVDPPQLSSSSLVDGQKMVSTAPSFIFEFSEPMDPTTIDDTSFELTEGGSPIAATVAYDANDFSVSVVPDSALSHDSDYQLRLSATIADQQGNLLGSDAIYAFRTAGLPQKISGFSDALHTNAVVAFNDLGHAMALWNVDSGAGYNLVYSFNDGTGWSGEQSLSTGSDNLNQKPLLQSDGSGFMAVWIDYDRHMHANYFNGSDWSGATRLDTQVYQSTPQMRTDGSGFALVWLSGSINTSSAHTLKAAIWDGTDWSESDVTSTGSGTIPFDIAVSGSAYPYGIVSRFGDSIQAYVYNGVEWISNHIYSNYGTYNYVSSARIVGSDSGFLVAFTDRFSGPTFKETDLHVAAFNGTSWLSTNEAVSIYDAFSIDYELVSNGTDYMLTYKRSYYDNFNFEWHYQIRAKSIDAAGAPAVGTETVADESSSIGAYVVDSNGSGYAVAWRHATAAYVSSYVSSWSTPVQLSNNVSGGGYSGQPFLLASSGTSYALLWNDQTADQPFIAFSTDWASAQRLSPLAETNPFRYAAIGENHTTGHYTVLWSQSGEMHQRSTYLASGDHTLNSPVTMSTGTYPGAAYSSAVLVSEGDLTAAIWMQYDEKIRGVYANVRENGVWATPVKLSQSGIAAQGNKISIACAVDSCVAAWASEDEIKTRRFIRSSGLWDAGDPVSAYTPPINQAYDPAIASNGSDYMLAFNYGGINVAGSADGVTWDLPTELSTTWADPKLASNGQGYLLVYDESSGSLRGKVFSSGSWSSTASYLGSSSNYDLASNGDSYMVVWHSSNRIYARSVSASGAVGGQTQLSSSNVYSSTPRVVVDGSDYVALWNRYSWGAYTSKYTSADSSWSSETRLFDGIAGPMANVGGHFLSLINEDDGLKGGYFNRSNDSADSGGVLDTTGGVLESYYMSASSDSVGFVGTYQVGSNGTREMWAIGAD